MSRELMDIELYGGKRGLLEHVRARILCTLGAYGQIREIEWAAVDRLVFICKGNICRSPYATARARALGVHAASFGLAAANGAGADRGASNNALLRGVDLSEHRSARITPSSISSGDLAVVFEPGHLSHFRQISGGRVPVTLLGIWTRPSTPHIQDPYARSDRYFQQCFSVIDAGVAALANRMAEHGAPVTASITQVHSSPVRSDPAKRTLV